MRLLAAGPTSDRAVAVDAAAVAAVSVAICAAADRLALMSALVAAVWVARLALWARALPVAERGSPAAELALLAACTALGAFNDWNTVVRHGVYAYTVPAYFPRLSIIPLWMLAFWGLVLRLMISLVRWRRLGPPAAARDQVYLGRRAVERPWLKLGVELVLLAVTRQLVYRYYADPLWSWLPFAVALAAFFVLFRPDRHDLRLVALFAVGGPAVEAAYIQLGHLHRYALGWLGGVPLWIVLWWVLAVLIGKDLLARAQPAR